MYRTILIVLVVLLPTVQSCQTSKQATANAEKKEMQDKNTASDQGVPKLKEDFSDLNGQWKLIKAVAGDQDLAIPQKTMKPIRLKIKKAVIDKTSDRPVNALFSGSGPVNGFGMEAKMITDGTIKANVLTQTAMADVRNEVNAFEKQYFIVLENAYQYNLKDGKLSLTSTEGRLVFERMPNK